MKHLLLLMLFTQVLGCLDPPTMPTRVSDCEVSGVYVLSRANVKIDTCWFAERAGALRDKAKGMGWEVGDTLDVGEVVVTSDPQTYADLFYAHSPPNRVRPPVKTTFKNSQAFSTYSPETGWTIVAKPGVWFAVADHELAHVAALTGLGDGDKGHQNPEIWEGLLGD